MRYFGMECIVSCNVVFYVDFRAVRGDALQITMGLFANINYVLKAYKFCGSSKRISSLMIFGTLYVPKQICNF